MEMNAKNNKILLGLSGGVDSASSALILKDKGYEVIGYYFDILGNKKELNDVKYLADQLSIELIYEDVSDDFKSIVINNFLEEYKNGRTPNPCIICNPNIKFKKLIENADKLGIDNIATGHYAKTRLYDGHYYIEKSDNALKDQSYMLYRLPESIIKRIIFPLGEFSSKDEVRALAKKKSLKNSDKHDSQEICFTDNYKDFITNYGIKQMTGNFVDKKGNILGTHNGIINYTIGQRKGLGIALGKPVFVIGIDAKNNEVVIGDDSDLFTKTVISINNLILNEDILLNSDDITAKIRYSQSDANCSVKIDNNDLITTFSKPQRAPTSGQSIVIYYKGLVIGGGFIK